MPAKSVTKKQAEEPAAKPPINTKHFQIIGGSTDILLIAPHACIRDGKTKDDENTGPIARRIAEQLGCSAIINTFYHKPDDKKYPNGYKPSKNEYPHGLNYGNLDLNVIEDAKLVPGYLDAIRAVVDTPGKTTVIWVHGADTVKARKNAKGANYDFSPLEIGAFIGYGQGQHPITKNGGDRFTADLATVTRLRDAWIENGMNAVITADDAHNYRGRSPEGMNQWFLENGYTLDQVESIQLEIRKRGFRDLFDNIEKTIGILAAALNQDVFLPAAEIDGQKINPQNEEGEPSDTTQNEEIDDGGEGEVQIKGKRGRPRFQREKQMNCIQKLHPNIRTRRGLQNKYYEVMAVGAIKGVEGMEFLCDYKKDTLKSSILTEIGRLEDEDEIRNVATNICEVAKSQKLSTKQWVELCRKIRLHD